MSINYLDENGKIDINKKYFYGAVLPEEMETLHYIPTVPEFLDYIKNQYSQHPAISDGTVTYNYDQLYENVTKRITFINSLGLKKGTNIGVIAPNNLNTMELFLAIPAAGHVVMVIPNALSEEQICGIIAKYDVEVVFAAKENLETVKKSKAKVFDENMTGDSEGVFAKVQKETPAVICLTAGTTGIPKAALLSHGAILRGGFDGVFAPVHALYKKYIAMLPFSHIFGSIRGYLTPLYTGSLVYTSLNMKASIMDIPKYRPTTLVLVPELIKIIMNIASLKGKEFLGDLDLVIAGGAPVGIKEQKACQKFGVNIMPGYGLTEGACMTAGSDDAKKMPHSVGALFPEQEAKIVDGELWIKGDNIMIEYYKDPKKTKEVLEDGWLKTGDLAKFEEFEGKQFLVITGRIKNLIILPNGENVSPEEIENIFYHYDVVKECLVKEMTKNGREVVGIEIFPDLDRLKNLSKEEIQEKIKGLVEKINKELPSYKRVLKLVVRDKEFQRSKSMKILRNQ